MSRNNEGVKIWAPHRFLTLQARTAESTSYTLVRIDDY